MSSFKTILAAGALALTSVSAIAADLSTIPSGKYAVDPTHAYVNFQYNHLGLSNPVLSFGEFDIRLSLDVDDASKSSATLVINTDSVITGSEIWHDHITSENWFNVDEYPEISFASTAVTENSDGTYSMVGDLTIRDVTKPVTLAVSVNGATIHPMAKKPVIGISATANVLRSEWGLGKSAPFVSDEVTISVTAELFPEG